MAEVSVRTFGQKNVQITSATYILLSFRTKIPTTKLYAFELPTRATVFLSLAYNKAKEERPKKIYVI